MCWFFFSWTFLYFVLNTHTLRNHTNTHVKEYCVYRPGLTIRPTAEPFFHICPDRPPAAHRLILWSVSLWPLPRTRSIICWIFWGLTEIMGTYFPTPSLSVPTASTLSWTLPPGSESFCSVQQPLHDHCCYCCNYSCYFQGWCPQWNLMIAPGEPDCVPSSGNGEILLDLEESHQYLVFAKPRPNKQFVKICSTCISA